MTAAIPVTGQSTPALPAVLFFSRDIFFAPIVKNAATSAGFQFAIVARADAALKADFVGEIRACIVDLTPLSLDEIAIWGVELANRFPGAQRIAFGPHVQVEHFAAAAAAGFEPVLAKGQVANILPRLLA